MLIGLLGSILTILIFVTGKNLPDFWNKQEVQTISDKNSTNGGMESNQKKSENSGLSSSPQGKNEDRVPEIDWSKHVTYTCAQEALEKKIAVFVRSKNSESIQFSALLFKHLQEQSFAPCELTFTEPLLGKVQNDFTFLMKEKILNQNTHSAVIVDMPIVDYIETKPADMDMIRCNVQISMTVLDLYRKVQTPVFLESAGIGFYKNDARSDAFNNLLSNQNIINQ